MCEDAHRGGYARACSSATGENEKAPGLTEDLNAFVFADLAGYTAVTEAHGDEQAADLAADFFSRARELLAVCDGEEVKLIGDELMARIRDPAAAIQFAHDLRQQGRSSHQRLDVRIGLHYGPAVRRGNDWFGATVNVAARVAGLAGPGEVLTTVEAAQAAGDIDGVMYRSRGEQKLKNVRRPMTLLAVVGDSEVAEVVRDPVCHMLLDPAQTIERLERNSVEYSFCSAECRGAFEREPELYA